MQGLISASRRIASGKWFGSPSFRKREWISSVRKAESGFAGISDKEIAERSDEIRGRNLETNGSELRSLRREYAGLIAESVYRAMGFRMFDVQVEAMGAACQNAIVEMQTGEGKTVVTGSIAALRTMEFPSVHVSTTNSYLADRDCDELSPVFEILGLSFGKLPSESDEAASRKTYKKQLVYGPGYQFGFDFLHDQMNLRKDRKQQTGSAVLQRIRGIDSSHKLIQPEHRHLSLIDEADSVMIDEAMTPLIISLPGQNIHDPVPYRLAREIVAGMADGPDYRIQLPEKSIEISDAASLRAHEKIAGQRNLFLARPWKAYLSNAIRAEKILKRDIDYVVVDEKIQLVDQNTGRIMDDRTWQAGLHQAIEVKENVPMQPARESTTQVTRQRYLQMYDSLAGLTGTAASVTEEFSKIYGCPVIVIPTNRPSKRRVERTRFFADAEAKFAAIADDVIARHATRQPVLVGTRTIQESIQINEVLMARGINAVILNGVQDGDEAEIVSKAGHAGAITIATNMAGRGTNIKPDKEALAAGGLHVAAVSPNESRRTDRQLIGRGARQGQPGSSQFFVAADDALLIDHQSPLSKQILRKAGKSGESADFSRELAALQKAIEHRNFKSRQQMILRDRWMDSVRESIEKY